MGGGGESDVMIEHREGTKATLLVNKGVLSGLGAKRVRVV